MNPVDAEVAGLKTVRVPEQVIAYIGIGSNLEQPIAQVQKAFVALVALDHSTLMARSSLYRSKPLGPAGQPDFINAVAALQTQLSPHALLRSLQYIEIRHGRVRGLERWGPRTLDLDLLLYGSQRIQTDDLQVPHVGLAQRAFVFYPLSEIAPDIDIPGFGPISGLLTQFSAEGLERLPLSV